MLRVAAITRYTGAYWGNYINAYGTQILLFRSKWWKRFWQADALGALSGGAGAALGGWLGVLWVAVIGGAAGSGGYAIFGD
jgi:hypothetical protein